MFGKLVAYNFKKNFNFINANIILKVGLNSELGLVKQAMANWFDKRKMWDVCTSSNNELVTFA